MSSNTKGEGDIRAGVVKADLVECMVAVPGQLFTNTQIPACIWFLILFVSGKALAAGTKTKQKRGRGAAAFRDRTGEVLFIDARQLGYMVDRVVRTFTDEATEKIVSTFHAWKRGPIVSGKAVAAGESPDDSTTGYRDIPGFCYAGKLLPVFVSGTALAAGLVVVS